MVNHFSNLKCTYEVFLNALYARGVDDSLQNLIKERWFYIIVGISDDNDLIYRAAGLVALVDPGYIWRINDGSANVARGVEKIRSLLSSVDEVSVTGMSKMLKAFDLESNVWTLINQAFKDGKIKE